MGDHRADIKIELTMHGKTYKQDWWINYWDDGTGVDYRVAEWFSQCVADAMARYDRRVAAIYAEATKDETERAEKAELVRLQTKYGAKS